MVSVKKQCFLSLTVTPALLKSVSTFCTQAICSVDDLDKIPMSSKYTRTNRHLTADLVKFIVR